MITNYSEEIVKQGKYNHAKQNKQTRAHLNLTQSNGQATLVVGHKLGYQNGSGVLICSN